MDTIIMRQIVVALGVLFAALGIGHLVRVVLVRHLVHLASRTATDLDDLLLLATKRHLPLWFMLAGVAIGARLAELGERAVRMADRVSILGVAISLTFALSGLAIGLISRQSQRAGASLGATTLAQNVVRLLIFAVGGLLLLSNLGISLTPLLTALGIGSLAVALALQPTLSNLFAGIHIALARPIRVGDFVQIESGAKGFVEDIGWRATRVRELPDNMIEVPNARVAEMIVTNYTLPTPEQAVVIQVGVAYGSDLEHVERVTCDVARQVLRGVDGGVAGFEPFIRYHTFGDSSIGFSVILRVKTYVDRYLVTHGFIKQLYAAFARERIEIPFPQRVLHRAAAKDRRAAGAPSEA
jgi:small-conductance mechanosensitive channel